LIGKKERQVTAPAGRVFTIAKPSSLGCIEHALYMPPGARRVSGVRVWGRSTSSKSILKACADCSESTWPVSVAPATETGGFLRFSGRFWIGADRVAGGDGVRTICIHRIKAEILREALADHRDPRAVLLKEEIPSFGDFADR
jgi:hypothetical protein